MIIVSGYYGFSNLGDEAILAVLCEDLEALGFSRGDILVLSQNPAETESMHAVQALERYNLAEIWRAFASARCLISGGGSLLQDVTSRRSIAYYLGLVELAFLRKTPVIMYGQGIGPVQNALFRRWVCRVYGRSCGYSVRDEKSAEFLAASGVSPTKGLLAADPVFRHELKVQDTAGAKKIVLNLRPYRGWQEQRALWIEQISRWQNAGYTVEFIPLGPGDGELALALRQQLPGLTINSDVSLLSMEKAFSGARLCVSMRLHGVIFAALHDVLPIGLNYDPKVGAIAAQLQVPYWELADLGSLAAKVEEMLNSHERYRLVYHRTLAQLREKALRNRAVLARVLLQG